MLRHAWVWLVVGAVVALMGVDATAERQPAGQLTIAFDTTIAPSYLDSAETTRIAAPFVFLYALHDALIKPLPGNPMAPCLSESWTESPDGLVYEFKLRQGLTFHNGDPFTAEDVQFSLLRYESTSAKLLHDMVKAVQAGGTPLAEDPGVQRVRDPLGVGGRHPACHPAERGSPHLRCAPGAAEGCSRGSGGACQ